MTDVFAEKPHNEPRAAIISLEHKDLTDLDKNLVSKCRQYIGVNLTHNRINFSSRFCSQLTFVRYLNLSYNDLTCLPQNFGDLVNLAVFEATHNQISKLPISLSECQNLRFMDLRQNPIVTTWSTLRNEKSLIFDPVAFANYIVPFMQAVRQWRQNLIYARAEEMLEFLAICPKFVPSVNDGYYDATPTDTSSCIFSNMYNTCPSKLYLILNSLQNPTPDYPQAFKTVAIFWTFVIFPVLKLALKTSCFGLILLFLAARLSGTQFVDDLMTWAPLRLIVDSDFYVQLWSSIVFWFSELFRSEAEIHVYL